MNLTNRIHRPALLLALLLALPHGHASVSALQDAEKAGLVVQFADGSVQTYCLGFAGESISGLDLLLKTGLPLQVEAQGGIGALVCKIGPDGCNYPEQPCVCQSYGPGGKYWSYHHLRGARWQASVRGADSYRVRNGEVEGWAWSDGSPPPLFTFEQLCRVAQPTQTQPPPTPRALPSATRQQARAKDTSIPQPTPTRGQAREPAPTVPLVIVSTVPPTATGTPQPTATQLPTVEPSHSSTPTIMPVIISTSTPTATPPPAALAPEGAAPGLVIIIGAVAIGGLLLGLVAMVRRGRGVSGVG